MRRWLWLVTEWPRATLALVALITVLFAAALPWLRIETDGHAFVPASHPVVREDKALRGLFGLRDPLLVALDAGPAGSAFSPGFLRRLVAATDTVRDTPGIEPASVTSLATLQRVERERGETLIRPLLEPLPATDEARDELRRYVLASSAYAGFLVARDGSATLVVASLERHADRTRVYADVRRRLQAAGTEPFHIAGSVAAESQLGGYIIDDLVTMLPLVSLVVGAVLFSTYRSVPAIVLPILEVAIAIVWTFGLMAMCGSPVYVVTAILPVILMAMGVADEIHIFGHYYEGALLHPEKARQALVVDAVEVVRLPIIFAAITTALGFLSFGGASMPPLQSFGLYTAFGVMAAMVLTLTLIPAALVLHPAHVSPRLRADLGARGDLTCAGRLARVLAALGGAVYDHRRAVLVLAVAAALACVPGIRRLYVQDSWFSNFGAESEVRKAGDFLDAKFSGSHELDVVIDSGTAGGALEPDFLARIDELAEEIGAQPSVGAVLSAIGLLQLLHTHLTGEDGAWIPATRAQASQLGELARFGGAVDFDHLLDVDRRSAVIRVFLREANYRTVDRLLQSVREAIVRHFARPRERVSLVGDVMVSQTTVGLIVASQIRTLVLAFGMVWLAASVMFRSLVGGTFAVLPLSLAVLLNFAVMGYANIPLGIATSMFASLAIGIGVDYAIHFLARYAQALRDSARAGEGAEVLAPADRGIGKPSDGKPRGPGDEGPAAARAAMRLTLATTGKAIFYNAAVVALGYLVLTASAMPPNRMLGLLVALSMATSFAAGVTLLPAALAVFRPAFLSRVRR